ncbi:hypothetical protein V8C26DRAFT_403586 [Trichoderma gracile]
MAASFGRLLLLLNRASMLPPTETTRAIDSRSKSTLCIHSPGVTIETCRPKQCNLPPSPIISNLAAGQAAAIAAHHPANHSLGSRFLPDCFSSGTRPMESGFCGMPS